MIVDIGSAPALNTKTSGVDGEGDLAPGREQDEVGLAVGLDEDVPALPDVPRIEVRRALEAREALARCTIPWPAPSRGGAGYLHAEDGRDLPLVWTPDDMVALRARLDDGGDDDGVLAEAARHEAGLGVRL